MTLLSAKFFNINFIFSFQAGLTGFIFAPAILGMLHGFLVKKGIVQSSAEKEAEEAAAAKGLSNDHTPAEAARSADV